jgi:hypothetical protein
MSVLVGSAYVKRRAGTLPCVQLPEEQSKVFLVIDLVGVDRGDESFGEFPVDPRAQAAILA